MAGLNTLFGIGNSALNATQTAISTTGNNIANLNTVGYSRQNVRFEDRRGISYNPGLLGQGVMAAEIYRNFNQFVENSYLDRYSQQNRWTEQNTIMQSVESLFNEANRSGISSAFGTFFDSWNNLNLRPDDDSTRQALLSNADTLAKAIANTRASLENMQHEMDTYIDQGVQQVNELIEGIRNLNQQISAGTSANQTPNQLLDQRDILVRKLSELVDIDVIERGRDFTIMTKSGYTLVSGESAFSLEVRPQRVENNLQKGSAYDGTLNIVGSDPNEYTFEVLTPPSAGATGTMRVSIDGGRTWLRNEDGSILEVDIPTAQDENIKVRGGLEISFTGDPTKLSSGDRFGVVPKSGLYWVTPTREPLNITPQVLSDGTDNPNRLVGGKLTSYFTVRDRNIGRSIDRLDALANSLIWEVNDIHSQGAGKQFTATIGTTQIGDRTKPMGANTSGLDFFDRLRGGNLSFQIYDANGEPLKDANDKLVNWPLDFDLGADGIQNFDPSKHSLEDFRDAINNAYADPAGGASFVSASIVDGKLQLTAKAGYSFAVAEDTTGALAALGVNTFFQGSDASDIAINSNVMQDASYINASKVNADGKIAAGDNATAMGLYNLAQKGVKISTAWESTTQTLGGYYGASVAFVGSETRMSKFNSDYNTALANDLDEQSAAISGVSLDEEMTNLIKYQHSYTAAAKLITTADQMLQTLLSLKQ